MTLGEALNEIDREVPNQFTAGEKIHWLSRLDQDLYRNILQTHIIPAPEEFRGYSSDTPVNTVLLAKAPYDELYRWYLELHIHGTNGEIARYNAAAAKFNQALLAYGDNINRSYPARSRQKMIWF